MSTLTESSKQYLVQTKAMVQDIELRFMALGERLYTIHENKLWRDEFDTYEQFLEDAKLAKSTANALKQVYRTYVIDHGVDPKELATAGYGNLQQAIPLIESKGIEKTVEMAKMLTRSEIKLETREHLHGPCAHEETITICAGCHQRM